MQDYRRCKCQGARGRRIYRNTTCYVPTTSASAGTCGRHQIPISYFRRNHHRHSPSHDKMNTTAMNIFQFDASSYSFYHPLFRLPGVAPILVRLEDQDTEIHCSCPSPHQTPPIGPLATKTVFAFKHLIGHKFKDVEVQEDMKHRLVHATIVK